MRLNARRPHPIYQNEPRDIVALVFRCSLSGGTLRTSDESIDIEWLDREQVNDRMTEAYAVRMIDALDYTDHASIRTHDGKHLTT